MLSDTLSDCLHLLNRAAAFVFATTVAVAACSDPEKDDTGGVVAIYGAPAPTAGSGGASAGAGGAAAGSGGASAGAAGDGAGGAAGNQSGEGGMGGGIQARESRGSEARCRDEDASAGWGRRGGDVPGQAIAHAGMAGGQGAAHEGD